MELSTFESILDTLNFTKDDWINGRQDPLIKKLFLINLTNDGNHYYDWHTQDIYFDTTNGIIKIKYFDYGTTDAETIYEKADEYLFIDNVNGFALNRYSQE